MTKQNIKSKQGFTIIEVVLVLAIAGLIFLMVFIALPAMQRSQRDTQRRNDYGMLASAVNQYRTNNNNALPTVPTGGTDGACPTNFTSSQINTNGAGGVGVDPNGNEYQLRCTSNIATANGGATANFNNNSENGAIVYIVARATCNNGVLEADNSNKSFAIYGQLESGTYCQAN